MSPTRRLRRRHHRRGSSRRCTRHLLPHLRRWARDRDFWVRRTALLAQLDALRRGGGDFDLFAEIAAPMLGEKEFFIRKALGWVLREVSKKRPALSHAFLRRHLGALSGLTLREGAKGVQLAELGMKSWKEKKWVDVPAL